MPASLRNCSVVVIGGTSGIGLEVARVAAAGGARVTAVGRTAEHARAAAATLGDDVTVRALNIADEQAVQALFESMTSIDHLVVTAGKLGFGRVADTGAAAMRAVFDERFWGVYHVVHHAVRLMPPTGSITLFSGNLAVKPLAGASVVSAAVAAVEAFGRGLAMELKPIRVNTVRSGAVDTPLFRTRPDHEELNARLMATLPVGRIGTPDDLAHAVVFLMTNGFTTGTVLQIDGGALIA